MDKLKILQAKTVADTEVEPRAFENIKEGLLYLDGIMLTEIKIEATMNDKEDIEQLISVLEIMKYCLTRFDGESFHSKLKN